jgi:cellulose synthase (UDP-forming)
MAAHRRKVSHDKSGYQKEAVIPTPPTPDEYYQYLGRQPLRILSVALFCLSLGAVYGVWAVFTKSYVWYPWLIILVVMVPWSLYIVILATFRPRVTWESHHQVVRAGSYLLTASVDVFIPVCGASIGIIRNRRVNVCRMLWKGPRQIYVLDDADDPKVKAVADKLGVNYLVRDNRPDFKKSGNLNYGLEHSNGRFVVVFDADFAPARHFLVETIPYMLYKNIGIIQTTQYFDVKISETRNWVQQLSSSTQDMFFCWAQPARNTADCGMCVGTNVVDRRKALEQIGGFPRVRDGGEDIVTSLDFYTKGFRTMYLPLNLAKGVCPDSFKGLVNQQYRWALTSLKLFGGKNEYRESFKRAPLNFRQRIVYWSGAVYYAQSILVLITVVVPSLVMLWNFPWMVGPGNYIPIAPAMLGMFALPAITRGWRPTTLRMIVVYSVAHLLAAIDAVKGKAAGWAPSGSQSASGALTKRAGRILRVWVIVTQTLTWIALAIDVPIYKWPAFWPAVVLCTFQTIILFPLLLPGYGTLAQFSLLPYLTRRKLWMRKVRKGHV